MIGVSVERMHSTCNEYAVTIVTGEVGFGSKRLGFPNDFTKEERKREGVR